jgi:hypothetical protein
VVTGLPSSRPSRRPKLLSIAPLVSRGRASLTIPPITPAMPDGCPLVAHLPSCPMDAHWLLTFPFARWMPNGCSHSLLPDGCPMVAHIPSCLMDAQWLLTFPFVWWMPNGCSHSLLSGGCPMVAHTPSCLVDARGLSIVSIAHVPGMSRGHPNPQLGGQNFSPGCQLSPFYPWSPSPSHLPEFGT